MKILDQPCAFVDLETTGANPKSDRITEIGLLKSDTEGNLSSWEQLLNPDKPIPGLIVQLTGISDEMVADKPCFSDIAESLHEKFQDTLFIAHNARFDYGFLKHAFKSRGLSFKPKIICTVKLARKLFPEWERHNLAYICNRIGYRQSTKHRAMADVNAMYAFLCYAKAKHGDDAVDLACQTQLKNPSLPPNISKSSIDNLPNTSGVYYFYSDDALLYIGKSINIRNRVKSHFYADHKSQREMTLSRSVKVIEYQSTAGELSALLLENEQIKTLSPIYNRKQRRYKSLWMWRSINTEQDFTQLVLDNLSSENWQVNGDYYGPFRSRHKALQALKKVAKENELCLKVIGHETGEGRCFARQLKHCRGACEEKETALQHNLRLAESLFSLKIKAWPYPGAIGIKETCNETGKTEMIIVDQWVYLGTVSDIAELEDTLSVPIKMFDIETYRIIHKAIFNNKYKVINLDLKQRQIQNIL